MFDFDFDFELEFDFLVRQLRGPRHFCHHVLLGNHAGGVGGIGWPGAGGIGRADHRYRPLKKLSKNPSRQA